MASAKANLPDTIVEVLRARHDLYFHPHEVERQVAPVDLREAHRVLLRGDDGGGLAFYFMRVEIKIVTGAKDFNDCVNQICFR